MDRSVTTGTKTVTGSIAEGITWTSSIISFKTKLVRSARVRQKLLQFWKPNYKLRLPKGGDQAAPVPKWQWSLACPYPNPSWAQRIQPCCSLPSAPLLPHIRQEAATAQIGTSTLHEASHSSLLSPGAHLCQKPPNFLPGLMPMDSFSYHIYLILTDINTA